MEKYGVDTKQEQLEKRAAKGCNLCGERLLRHGEVFLCPKHGSLPFEEANGSQEDDSD